MSECTIKSQLTITQLIFKLLLKLFTHGNMPVYYHVAGHNDCPLEVEGVEIRTTYEDKLTIY